MKLESVSNIALIFVSLMLLSYTLNLDEYIELTSYFYIELLSLILVVKRFHWDFTLFEI